MEINVIVSILQIREFISQNKFLELKEILAKAHYIDIAENFEDLNDDERLLIFRFLDKYKCVKVFELLPFKLKFQILKNLKDTEISDVLNDMASNKRADFFKRLPQRNIPTLLGLMETSKVTDLEKLIDTEEGVASSLMTTKFVTLVPDMTVKDALLKLQEYLKAEKCEQICTNFVCDEKGVLVGIVNLQDLIRNTDTSFVKEIMLNVDNIKLKTSVSKEKVLSLFLKYKLTSLPVVDNEDKLVGIIFFEDIVSCIQQRNIKDIYTIGKMQVEDNEELKYSNSTIFDLIKRRAGWFFFLLVFDFLTGMILKTYELAITRVVALSFFIPMILDTGGNAGTQTAVSIVRDMETGKANFKNLKDIIVKELTVAVFMGTLAGFVCFTRAYFSGIVNNGCISVSDVINKSCAVSCASTDTRLVPS